MSTLGVVVYSLIDGQFATRRDALSTKGHVTLVLNFFNELRRRVPAVK